MFKSYGHVQCVGRTSAAFLKSADLMLASCGALSYVGYCSCRIFPKQHNILNICCEARLVMPAVPIAAVADSCQGWVFESHPSHSPIGTIQSHSSLRTEPSQEDAGAGS